MDIKAMCQPLVFDRINEDIMVIKNVDNSFLTVQIMRSC